MILSLAIAAFLAADITLAVFWYLYSDDDPDSQTYVPSDWKQLVLANLGVASPQTVPAQYIGQWNDASGHQIVFRGRGEFSSLETAPGDAEDILLQSTGRVFAADPQYITVKTTTVQKFRVTEPPTRSEDGTWTLQLDGKTFKKYSHPGNTL